MDGNELAARKTVEEKERIQNKEIRQAALKVVAYIALALLYYMATIQLRVSLTLYLNLCSIYCSMQKSLSVYMIKFMQQPLDLYRRRCRPWHGVGL